MVKRKPQKAPKGSDKNKEQPDIAKIFLGKEAASAAAKASGEKSPKSSPVVARGKSTKKISFPVKTPVQISLKKSFQSKKGQSSTKESNPKASSSGLQPITSTPNPPKKDAAPYRTNEKIFSGVKTKKVVYDRCLLFRPALDPGVKDYNPIMEVTN